MGLGKDETAGSTKVFRFSSAFLKSLDLSFKCGQQQRTSRFSVILPAIFKAACNTTGHIKSIDFHRSEQIYYDYIVRGAQDTRQERIISDTGEPDGTTPSGSCLTLLRPQQTASIHQDSRTLSI